MEKRVLNRTKKKLNVSFIFHISVLTSLTLSIWDDFHVLYNIYKLAKNNKDKPQKVRGKLQPKKWSLFGLYKTCNIITIFELAKKST